LVLPLVGCRRTSISSGDNNNPVIEEAAVGMKAEVNTLNQLSSFARAAQEARAKKPKAAVDDAMVKAIPEGVVREEESSTNQERVTEMMGARNNFNTMEQSIQGSVCCSQ
jgi:HAMP domain-containing protein